MTNTLSTLIFGQSSCRAHLTHLSDVWQQVLSHNTFPAPVQQVLGELVVASLLLSASIKFDGSLIIQIQGDGPIQLLVAECNNRLGVRAMVKLAKNALIASGSQFKDLVNANGKGICAIIFSPSNRQPGQTSYQSMVPLVGNTVAESIEAYMFQSEQLETRLILNANAQYAAGLMLQKMPRNGGIISTKEFDVDGWNRLQALAGTLEAPEHLNTEIDELTKRLFWEESPDHLVKRQAHFECTCSREKVSSMLLTLGQAELRSALSEKPTLEIRCDFCNAHYLFTHHECEALLSQNLQAPDSSEQQQPTLH